MFTIQDAQRLLQTDLARQDDQSNQELGSMNQGEEMKIVVFGASGRMGMKVVEQAKALREAHP